MLERTRVTASNVVHSSNFQERKQVLPRIPQRRSLARNEQPEENPYNQVPSKVK